MKVIHYPSVFLAPSETFIARYIQSTQTWAMTSVMSGQFDDGINAFAELRKVPVHHLTSKTYNRSSLAGLGRACLEKVLRENLHVRSIRRVLKEQKPDFVHCHFGPQGLAVKEAMKKLAIPFAVSFYGYDATKKPLEQSDYKKSLTDLFFSCNGIFVEGPHFKKQLITDLQAPDDKIHINPILIPVTSYQKQSEVYTPGNPIRFLLAGRFVEKKGFHLFLEAIGGLKEELPAFFIEFIGNGPFRERYTNLIDKYNLEDKIEFLGWKNHEELLRHIQSSDFFVHPSITAADGDTEGGAPTILIEAQAIKTPVISSRHADIPYVMGYDNFLCKEGDIEDLRHKIFEAVTSHHLKSLVEQGYQQVLEQHDINTKLYRKNIERLVV